MALTRFQGTDTSGRMGRPPLNVKETKVRLSKDAPERIERLVGKNKMAAFIREIVDAELDRRESEARERDG